MWVEHRYPDFTTIELHMGANLSTSARCMGCIAPILPTTTGGKHRFHAAKLTARPG